VSLTSSRIKNGLIKEGTVTRSSKSLYSEGVVCLDVSYFGCDLKRGSCRGIYPWHSMQGDVFRPGITQQAHFHCPSTALQPVVTLSKITAIEATDATHDAWDKHTLLMLCEGCTPIGGKQGEHDSRVTDPAS
jgi:hypothetical protein